MRIAARLTAVRRLLALPELCPGCRCSTRAGFCDVCAARFEAVAQPCRVCALPCPAGPCLRHDAAWRIERTFAPFVYADPLAAYLQALKFARGRTLGRALALLLVRPVGRALEGGELATDALLVPVPLSLARLRERGYNQATEIARTLAAETGLALAVSAVSRPLGAPAQSRLRARARRANVAQAFRAERSLRGRCVAIVDDVITTGATVNSLAAALHDAGAARVTAIAVARTLAPLDQETPVASIAPGTVRNT